MNPILADFDPFGREFQQDPHPFYDAMRAESPAWFEPTREMYFVTRHDLVSAVVKDPQTFSSAYGATANEPPAPHLKPVIEEIKAQGWVRPPTMLTIDPPDHTRYRGTVAKAFNARVVNALRPAVLAIVEEELELVTAARSVDVNHTFSDTVPVRVIIRTLDLPVESQADVKRWSDETTAGIGTRLSDERAIRSARGVVELQRYMHAEITKRLEHPTGDIISMLVDADFPLEDGVSTRKLVIEESMGILQALIGAGNETTTKLFSQMLMYLAQDKEQWWKLKADPSRAANIVEDSLRLSSPTQGLYRVATRDTEIGGVPIPQGARVFAAFAAANRDPAVFPDPHRLDPDRPNVRDHLAFGGGVHFCLGAPLARLESVIALESIARRWNDFHLSDRNTYEYLDSYVLRGLLELHVDIEPAV